MTQEASNAALRSDVERVDFIARLYGAVMADRMRQMFDAVPDDGTCDGFAQSVRRSIDGEMGAYDDYAAASKARYLKERAEAEQERRRREFWLTVEAVFAPAFVQKLRRWSK